MKKFKGVFLEQTDEHPGSVLSGPEGACEVADLVIGQDEVGTIVVYKDRDVLAKQVGSYQETVARLREERVVLLAIVEAAKHSDFSNAADGERRKYFYDHLTLAEALTRWSDMERR